MRKTKLITVTGTMQQLVPAENKQNARLASKLVCQMLAAAGGGIGYVQIGCPIGTAASSSLAFQMAPAIATAPGGTFSETIDHPFSGERIDLSEVYVDGAHNGDTMLVSWWEIPG